MNQGLNFQEPSLVSYKLSVLFYFLNSLHGNVNFIEKSSLAEAILFKLDTC
jgi:hypothetical protein